MSRYVRRGEVVVAALDPTRGTEIRKTRPCVVVSNDVANEVSPQLTVVPATGYDPARARFPVCVDVPAGEGGLDRRSVALCSQIRTLDKARVVGRPLGRLSGATMERIDRALKIHLALP